MVVRTLVVGGVAGVAALVVTVGGQPASTSVAPPAGSSWAVLRLTAPAATQEVSYRSPVRPLHVVRGFDPPAGPYAPGHRGVDLAAHSGLVVRAAARGVVRFAGSVAGRGVVVLLHPDGISTEYEPVAPSVRRGEPVARGQPIGRVSGLHGGCAPGACLHWGARRDDAYVDPLTLLPGRGVVRLLPWH